MIVARAIEVTPARLVYSNVPDNDHPEWAAGTYPVDALVIKDNHIWASVAASNTAVPGAETALPFKWVDQGAINRWKMFDKRKISSKGRTWLIGTFTENPDSIEVVFQAADVVNAIGIVGISAASVSVEIEVPDQGVIYDKNFEMADYGVDNWFDYFFAPIERKESLAILDIPPYGNALIKITASAPGAIAKIGTMVFGYQEDLGAAIFGTSVEDDDYGITESDPWGNINVTPGGSRDVVNFDVVIETSRTGYLRRRMRELKSHQTLYVGSDKYEVTIIVGISGGFNMVLNSHSVSKGTITVRSLQ